MAHLASVFMAILRIDSLDDPRLAPYRNLKTSNDTRHAGCFVAEGQKLVERLLASDCIVRSLLVADRYLAQCAQRELPLDLLSVPDDWIERIVGFNFHRGILACAERPPAPSLQSICRASRSRTSLVVCPDVQNPENLGAIVRIASAFAVDAVVLGDGCCDPFSRRVLRVSMGAVFGLPILETEDLAADLCHARDEQDFRVWATVADSAAAAFHALPRPNRLALLLGSEGHGLADCWLAMCDQRVTIPMRPSVDSLNVAVAAGILLYHLSR
jgi:tRNA G18 (ribose-2'-O)-methylase SpoU